MHNLYVLIVLYISAGFAVFADENPSNELKDYCSMNRFEESSDGLGFAKEVVAWEYANSGALKAIHCCLRGYRSIEWYKDNKPYPWPGGKSQFILYPESENQTIYAQEARPLDAGNYSCEARNDTTTLRGEIILEVIENDSGYTGEPLPTYKPTDQFIPLGVTTRLFCEAYIGRIYLPDVKNSVVWSKIDSNTTLPTSGRISQNKVSREDDQIIGLYLEIKNIQNEDYGQYKCEISNSINQRIIMTANILEQEPEFLPGMKDGSWRKALLLASLVVVIGLSLVAFYIRFWLPFKLFLRDRFSTIEENDDKDCDALVCYHEKDASLALGVIIPILESKYCYKCGTLELSRLSQNWSLEIGPRSKTARRVIVVASPSAVQGNAWNEATLTTAFGQLALLKFPSKRTIVIALKDLPDSLRLPKPPSSRYGNDGEFDIGRIKILRWHEEDGTSSSARAYKFWSKLRLYLPPIRPGTRKSQQSIAIIVQAKNVAEPKARSRESLEVLV